jgi:hypothetical protein
MLMPIPKPIKLGDTSDGLEYMSVEDAMLLPFTDVYQSSPAATAPRTDEVAKKKKALGKISSSGKAKQYEIPPDMEQLRGLPKSSLPDRNVRSNARCRVGMVAQWLASLSLRPWGLRDLLSLG